MPDDVHHERRLLDRQLLLGERVRARRRPTAPPASGAASAAAASASTASAATAPAAAPARPARSRTASGRASPPTRGPIRASSAIATGAASPAATTAPATGPGPAASTPPGPNVWRPGAPAAPCTRRPPATARAPATRARPRRAARTSATRRARPAGRRARSTPLHGVLQRHRVRRDARQPGGQRRRRERDGEQRCLGDERSARSRDRRPGLPTPARTAHRRHGAHGELQRGRPTRYRRARATTPSAPGRCRTRTRPRTSRCRCNLSCGEPPAGGMFPTVGHVRHHACPGVWTQIERHGEPGGQRGLPAWSRDARRGEVGDAVPQSDRRGQHRRLPEPVPRRRRRPAHRRAQPGRQPELRGGHHRRLDVDGGGTLAISTAVFMSGGRAAWGDAAGPRRSTGPRWAMPIGAAKYNVTFNGLHNGSFPHDLILQPTYTCRAGRAQFPAPIATASQVGGNGWNTLTGTVTFPPANAAGRVQADGRGHLHAAGRRDRRAPAGGVSRSLRRRCVDHPRTVTFVARTNAGRRSRRPWRR